MARSFKRVTANARELQNTTIGNFNGVDLSNPTLQANTARSVELLNFVKKQKFNQKRFGFHQVISKDTTNTYHSEIHGVWSFIDSTNTERVIAHVDDHFVVLTQLGSEKSYFDFNENDFVTWIKDVWSTSPSGPIPIYMEVGPEENSFGFASDGYLYVLGGGKYIRFLYSGEINSIVAEDLKDNYYSTYIPLTRNSVVPTGSLVEGLSQAYDDVNMLTQWKKNALITGTFGATLSNNPFNSSGFTEYKLDSIVNPRHSEDLLNSRLKISYLQTNASNLINPAYTSATLWSTNVINIGPAIPLEIDFNDFIFAKVAYRSTNPGRDFSAYDIGVRLKYKLSYYGSAGYVTTPYFKTNGTGGLIVHNTADTTVYTPSNATAYKYVIDYRPAIAAGHLTGTFPNFTVSASAEVQGFFQIPIKLFVILDGANNLETLLTRTIKVPVQTSAEFLAYQTKVDIVALPDNITTHELMFKDGGTDIAKLFFNDNGYGRLHIYYKSGNEYENPTPGIPNIELIFPSWVPGYSERVTDCKFGKLWGYNGARNRLFISGNETFKNIVYHSTQVNFYTKLTSNTIENLNNDFTYFSDLDYNIMGTDNSRVKALEVLANGSLLVLKEENSFEASVYTIKASLTKALAFDGSAVKAGDGITDLQEEIYLANIGNQGHGGVNPLAVANINSDTIFLSKVGLRAFIISENLPIEETRSVSASTLIDKKLLQDKDYFSNAVMYSFGEYLYLALNGTIYVASEQYLASDIGPKEYEWWVLKGYEYLSNDIKNYADIKVRNFLTYDGELYFYNQDGLFKFVENQYVDKQSIFFPDGYITYTHPNQYDFNGDETLLYTNPIVLQNLSLGKYISFKTEQYHAISSVTHNATTNRITFTTHPTLKPEEIYEGRKVIFTSAGSNFLGNYYYLYNVNNATTPYSAQLKDVNGNIVTSWVNFYWGGPPTAILSGILEPGKELKVNFINQNTSEFTVMTDFDVVVRFAYIHMQTPVRKFYIVTNDNVVAYFVTAPFNFGSNSQYKTIERFVLTNDTRVDSYVEILYIASNQADTFKEITNSNNNLNFSNITMTNLYFGSAYLPLPFTLRANIRNVSSIMFKFYNDRDDNACLTNLTMLYYVTKKVR
jgi:hypothetical protein